MTAPIDPMTLAQPIISLLGTFGSGAAGSFGGATGSMCSAQDSGRRTQDRMEGWAGSTGQAAQGSAQTNQASMASEGARGEAIAGVVSSAANTVSTGKLDVQGVLDSFMSVATTLAPTLGLPSGQVALLQSAADHVGEAAGVVEGVNQQMAGHTAEMAALAGQETPPSTPAPADGGETVTLPDGTTATAPNAKAAAAVRSALAQQGVPYSWGGTTPSGFDCSGLTQFAYAQAGVDIPRLAADQSVGSQVSAEAVMPGDLAVWDGHVAMVIGNGQMVEAGDPVEVSPIRTENQGQGFHGFYRPTA